MAVVLGVCDVERPQIRLHTRQGPFKKSQPMSLSLSQTY
jgi:hypothetical protein